MICAKAANMDLVVFTKSSNRGWLKLSIDQIGLNECLDYFACLQRFEKECLHWLNGGELIATKVGIPVGVGSNKQTKPCWSPDEFMMTYNYEYKIKPRTEPRWIRVRKCGVSLDTMILFNSEDAAKSGGDYQIFEIEVEVK